MISISPWTWFELVFFFVLTCIHAASLKRLIPWSFRTHLWIMRGLWNIWNVSIVALIFLLPHKTDSSPSIIILGIALIVLGLGLNIWHRRLLGLEKFMGGRCFDKQYDARIRGGLYRYLRNPIYDGIILTFIGLAMSTGNIDFLVLALASFLFLNVLIARIEGTPQ